MIRIDTFLDIKRLNEKASNFEESVDILKEFVCNECTDVILKGESSIFPEAEDFIMNTKHLVERINKNDVIIHSTEHTPPNFHFRVQEYESSYEIRTCRKLKGNIPRKYEKKLLKWYDNGGKEKLIEKWNSTRPHNCPVGKI